MNISAKGNGGARRWRAGRSKQRTFTRARAGRAQQAWRVWGMLCVVCCVCRAQRACCTRFVAPAAPSCSEGGDEGGVWPWMGRLPRLKQRRTAEEVPPRLCRRRHRRGGVAQARGPWPATQRRPQINGHGRAWLGLRTGEPKRWNIPPRERFHRERKQKPFSGGGVVGRLFVSLGRKPEGI